MEEIRRLNRNLEEQTAVLIKSEEALREQTRILRSVLDCMGEGVIVADRDFRLLLLNPAAARILGLKADLAELEPLNAPGRVYWPDRVTPFAADDLPLYSRDPGRSRRSR